MIMLATDIATMIIKLGYQLFHRIWFIILDNELDTYIIYNTYI